MTSVTVARRIGVVFKKIDRATYTLIAQTLLGTYQQLFKNSLACFIVNDHLVYRVTLGRCIFGVRPDI